MSTFADPEVITLCETAFVPVCTDDWYTRRRRDDEGEFFHKVAVQGPRKDRDGTRQGIYVFTADGELLGFKNAGQDAKVMKQVFADALAKFKKLPAARTKPGAVTVPAHGKLDPNYTRPMPDGTLVVRANARILDRKGDAFAKGTCEFSGGDRASRDFLWLTKDEVKALAPEKAEVGFSYPVPEKVAERIARFHLTDNTRGEPSFWKRTEVRKNQMTLTVVAVDAANGVELRLDGAAALATDADLTKAERGFEVKLRGKLNWRPKLGTFDKFDLAGVGDHWGRSTHTPGDRPGRSLLGVAFGLADPDKPSERIAPQGLRDRNPYWGKE